MAKQQVAYVEDLGATIIYQKQSTFNGYSFVIGFRSGAQLDGKYKGLSHLLEHLLFRNPDKDMTNNILNDIVKYSINQNAYTSKNFIVSVFSATQANVKFALNNCVRTFTNKNFSKDQIKKEIEIVKHEIDLKKYDILDESVRGMAFETLISHLTENEDVTSSLDILGTPKTLNSITPEILTEYVERYFNLDNMVISITSNKSFEDAVNICAEYIFPHFKRASEEKYIVPLPEPETFKNVNMLYGLPIAEAQNVTIELLLRERGTWSENLDKELAYATIEEYMMNTIGGLLWDTLRIKNNLVYSSHLANLDYGSAKFKCIQAITSAPKMRKTISEICKCIKNISENGFPKEFFETVKQALTDTQNASLLKFKSCSAYGNFADYITSTPFVDYKKAYDYIKTMTYEEFNEYITSIYKQANVSVAIEGNFDSRKVYNLVEIEEMLGNYRHKEQKENLNQPVIQATSIPSYESEMIAEFTKMIAEKQASDQDLEKETPTVTIDDQLAR